MGFAFLARTWYLVFEKNNLGKDLKAFFHWELSSRWYKDNWLLERIERDQDICESILLDLDIKGRINKVLLIMHY